MLIVATNAFAETEESTSENKNQVKKHQYSVNGEAFSINEYIINGVKAYAISDPVKDKKAVSEFFNNKVQEFNSANNANLRGTSAVTAKALSNCSSLGQTTTSNLSSNAVVSLTGTHCLWETIPFPYILTYLHASYQGTQTGKWLGTTPVYPDAMIFNQVTIENKIDVTSYWPAFWTVSNSIGSWSSKEITGVWIMTIERPKVEGVGGEFTLGYPTYTIKDSVDIYLPNVVYRPEINFTT